jgi:DNA-binding transcriptional MerR regulator
MKTKLIAGLVVLSLVATTTGVVLARDNLGMQPPEGMQPPIIAQQWPEGQCDEMDLLMEEEREEIQQQMEEFRQELREQYSDNPTEEEREEMAQEMQNFWEQLCDQYNISCPNGYRYWAAEGGSINGTVGPERQMD